MLDTSVERSEKAEKKIDQLTTVQAELEVDLHYVIIQINKYLFNH